MGKREKRGKGDRVNFSASHTRPHDLGNVYLREREGRGEGESFEGVLIILVSHTLPCVSTMSSLGVGRGEERDMTWSNRFFLFPTWCMHFFGL